MSIETEGPPAGSKPAKTKPTKTTRPQAVRTLSCGIVPVYRDASGKTRYLLLRCYNYWDFPKGGLNPGEQPLDGAIRELREETTLEHVEFPWGLESRDTPVYAQGKVARYFIGRVFSDDVSIPINPQIGRAEHHEFRWFSYQEARKLVHERVRAILDWAQNHVSQKPTAGLEERSPGK